MASSLFSDCRDASGKGLASFAVGFTLSRRGSAPRMGDKAAFANAARLPQKHPAVHMDILSGDEARLRPAQETHGRGDVGGLAAPADERTHERVVLRLRPPRPAR